MARSSTLYLDIQDGIYEKIIVILKRSEESTPRDLRLEDPSQNHLRMTKKEERNDFHRFVGIG